MSEFPSPTGFYKVLDGKNGPQHGGKGKWRIGKRRSVRGELVACENGLHAVTLGQLPMWLGPSIHPVLECSEERVDAGDKWVFRWLVIGEAYETWNERSARHFAADCAARALREVKRLHGWEDKRCNEAVRVARRYADGVADDEARLAARSAARSAAWSAAGSAAWSAAWSAAESAVGSAAESAAWSAARSAVGSAAGSAAGLAARPWQAKRLSRYLKGALPR